MKKTAVLIGAGGRGAGYALYASKFGELKIIAVAEPKEYLRTEFVKKYKIAEDKAFNSWEQLLAQQPLADCAMICTQDNMHYEPCKKAIEVGYKYILLEKPISPSLQECEELVRLAEKYSVNIQVCHSLRYTKFYRKIKEIIDSGTIGNVVNISQIEGVGFFHFAHSYVRGNWSNSETSSPIILAKCCHDLDILVYLMGKKSIRISSCGELLHFKKENAPKGSTDRCTDGCLAYETCPYNAVRIYGEIVPNLFQPLAVEKEGFDNLNDALTKGRYGRCVYKCDNNVPDHQLVNIVFENGASANLTMSAFTQETDRHTRIMGTRGEIIASMEEGLIKVYDFAMRIENNYKITTNGAFHAGADEIMIRDFASVVRGDFEGNSDIALSVHSHKMAHLAEKSRLEHREIMM